MPSSLRTTERAVALALLAAFLAPHDAFAQAAAKPAAASTPAASAPPAAAPIDPEKQKLIDRLLKSWHPEAGVVERVQSYAESALGQARIALQQQRLPADKIEKDLQEMVPDVQKYIDTTRPLLEASIRKNTSPAVSATLAAQLSVDELKQLVAIYESPLTAKFAKMQPELDRAVGERVQADIGAQVSKSIEDMTKAVGTKLRADATVK